MSFEAVFKEKDEKIISSNKTFHVVIPVYVEYPA